jgi:hypothetical protein
MSYFDDLYGRISKAPDVQGFSPKLRPLLEELHREIERKPADLSGLRASMISLLEFLASPEGRTSANCWMADLFVTHVTMVDHRAGEDVTGHLPEEHQDVIYDMSMLHDTFHAPQIAWNFDSTPEQLLERAQALEPQER